MYKFQPILKSLIWGGEKIAPYKGIATDQRNIGESWELSGVKDNESVVAEGPEAGTSLPELIARHGAALLGKANYERFGEEFPLLIKFIDARQDLSIQVHPNDELAWERHKSKGKTEMWYVVSADKDAHLRSGFSKQVTPAEYEASVGDNTITDILADYKIAPGDVFFLPAGRVHSIGAGSFIAEIQQTSNITYRIYDFNRKDADGNTVQPTEEESAAALQKAKDAAAAVLLEANTEGLGIVDSILHSDGSGEMQLYMKAGGSRYPASIETVQNNWHTIMWDGHAVFKAAVSKMSDVSVEMMERHNLKGEDIRFLVPHQANLRIIDATARRMGITQDKCMINIDKFGNTTAATIPLCLWDYESRLKKGDNLILAAFGGG